MNILILTQYFPPEVGAPQNRLFELAVRLKKEGCDITVLTAMPNYPQMEIHKDYQGLEYKYEEMDGLKVHRSTIYVSKKRDVVARLRNYFSFVRSSFRTALQHIKDKPDIILCESPPLFLGYTAVRLARRMNAKLVFNVSDLWPESAKQLGIVTNPVLIAMAYKLESWIYRNAVIVTGQTLGIVNDIRKRFPSVTTHWLPNGVDPDLYKPEAADLAVRNRLGCNPDDILCMYAGIIGHAQGLEVMVEAARLLEKEKQIKFIIVGSGPEKELLEDLIKRYDLKNIRILPTVPKSEMPSLLASADLSIIPLRKTDLFKGAIPSKIFEALAMEKPILLGVEGEAYDHFIRNGKCGRPFEPENAKQLAEQVHILAHDPDLRSELGKNGRAYVLEHFNRQKTATEFLKHLNQIR